MADIKIDLLSKNINNLKEKLENFQIRNNYDEVKRRLDKYDKECRKLENDIEDIIDLFMEEDNEYPNFKTLINKFDEQRQELKILDNNLQKKRNQLKYENKKAENDSTKDLDKEKDNPGFILDVINEKVAMANENFNYMIQEGKHSGK